MSDLYDLYGGVGNPNAQTGRLFAMQPWIQALFIRSDGKRFLLGGDEYPFSDSQQHFTANSVESDVLALQGQSGAIFAGQVERPATQDFDGVIADFTTDKVDTEKARVAFLDFFQISYSYIAVFVRADGSAIQRRGGYIADAPQVKEILQLAPIYHVALGFEDTRYYTYMEDEYGVEILDTVFALKILNMKSGGVMWDASAGTTPGAEWDTDTGLVWEAGVGGYTRVLNSGVSTVYPRWAVEGFAVNPSLINLTTGQTLTFTGTIIAGMTLVVDLEKHTATLNGANVYGAISGDWVGLAEGNNSVGFSTASYTATTTSTLSWRTPRE